MRLRYRMTDSYLDSSDSKTTTMSYEQVYGLKLNTLLFYFSYDRMRMVDEVYDTNSFTFRGDLILAKVKDWFTPSLGLGLTRTDPINNEERGRELLVNPNLRISRSFGKHWRGNLKYDYQNYKSDDEENFCYKKTIISFELEYIF